MLKDGVRYALHIEHGSGVLPSGSSRVSRNTNHTAPHASGVAASPLFSHSHKRVRSLLKIRDFNCLHFHTDARSFAGSPLFSHSSQKRGCFFQIASDFGIFGGEAQAFHADAALLRFSRSGLAWSGVRTPVEPTGLQGPETGRQPGSSPAST